MNSCLRILRPRLSALAAVPAPRWASSSSANRVPTPIPLVPDVKTFLSVIGRNMKQHAAKFPTWEALFTLSSTQLRELGVEPARDRRYLMNWCQRFRDGQFGVGGDFAYVKDGVALLEMREHVDPENPLKVRKTVVNVPMKAAEEEGTEAEAEGAEAEGTAAAETAETTTETAETAETTETAELSNTPTPTGEPVRVHGYKVVGARSIAGKYALPLKDFAGAHVQVTEGMWEFKRGRKIDGGERRQAEVRFKRRVAERRAQREQLGLP